MLTKFLYLPIHKWPKIMFSSLPFSANHQCHSYNTIAIDETQQVDKIEQCNDII